MIEFDRKNNLLMQNKYQYSLQDVEEPNLYREIFDYEHIPKVAFNMRNVPMSPPDEIWLTDTTFRDGQQSVSPFTPKQILHLFKLMSRLGGPRGMIRQSEFFLYTKNDQEALHLCQDAGLKFPEITTWIRANEKDFELVKAAGVQETGILVSCSDYHIFNKMHLTRAQAMDKYLGIVKTALSYGIRPRCHFEDITRADYYGFVVPFATELMKLSRESGIPIKIRACDIMGYGVSYPGAALPRSVPGIIYGLRHYAEVPAEQLEWHGHNDFYKAVSNSSTAWLYGASSVNCALLGIGERCGNTPLEAMIMEYASLRGTTNGMDTTVITEIGEYFEHEIGYEIPVRTPFVGRDFNITRAGVHADGLMKDEEIYNIFNTEKLLKRPAQVAISATSGLAGIAHWLAHRCPDKDAAFADKRSPVVKRMKELIDAEYESGRTTTMSDAELLAFYRTAKQETGGRAAYRIED
jgi:isopropylmalate/homocitrate/citramalate synthase